MARLYNRLAANGLKGLPDGMHADGDGLYLRVSGGGSARSWVFRFRREGKLNDIGIGPLRLISLSQAREKVRAMRLEMLGGSYPLPTRKRATQSVSAVPVGISFEAVARDAVANQAKVKQWSNAKHEAQWTSTLVTYAFPTIGKLPVSGITRADVLSVLEPIWYTKTETARRLQQRLRIVLDYAKAHGMRSGDNPAEWKGGLDALLAAPDKVQTVEHHEAMPWADVPAMLANVRKMETTAARAIVFGVLTATRAQEFCGATWDEFDLDAGVWSIPEGRMKAGKAHRIPLVPEVVEMLRALPRGKSAYVFPGQRGGHISRESPRIILQREFKTSATMHGFRSSFREWAAENGKDHTLAEMALAHTVGNEVERAYQRSDLLELRRPLMADWTAFCLSHKGSDI